jgi:hypothetical protein
MKLPSRADGIFSLAEAEPGVDARLRQAFGGQARSSHTSDAPVYGAARRTIFWPALVGISYAISVRSAEAGGNFASAEINGGGVGGAK